SIFHSKGNFPLLGASHFRSVASRLGLCQGAVSPILSEVPKSYFQKQLIFTFCSTGIDIRKKKTKNSYLGKGGKKKPDYSVKSRS
uniref:Uncharacterized protein n=1 Tax=Calidris pygmaea TaxID=425635 RepID=A0A8C3JHX7_9CHAR